MSEMEAPAHIPTRCSKLQNVDSGNVQVVVHKKDKKSINVKHAQVERSKDSKVETKELDMKKVRYEVFKFGMSGFKPEKKEEVKVALAIKLGAKPPKKKCYNYKEYKLMKEKQLKEQLEQRKLLLFGKRKTGKRVTKAKKNVVNRKGNGILDTYGKTRKVQTIA